MLLLLERDPEDDLLAGSSPAAARLRNFVERVARTPKTTVLISGGALEAELLARAIHGRTTSRPGPLVPVEGGADACEPVEELAALARHGTLHWKRVAFLDAARQMELSRFLEDRAGSPAADEDPRIVASDDVDLASWVQEGRFREDLYYRLNVLTIRIPPLTERRSDLEWLARRALRAARSALGKPVVLSHEALELLRSHAWPGGWFELEALLLSAAVRCRGNAIGPEDVQPGIQGESPIPDPATGNAPLSLRDLEESAIRRALCSERGNRSRAARSLGIHRATLYNKLRLYGIA